MNANEVFKNYMMKLNSFANADEKFDALIEAYDSLSDAYTEAEKMAIYNHLMLIA